MGMRLPYFLSASTQKENKQTSKRAFSRYGSTALSMFHYHPSARPKPKESRGLSIGLKKADKKHAKQLSTDTEQNCTSFCL